VAFNAAPLQAVTGPKCASTAGNISGLSPQLLGYVQTGNVMAKNLLPCLPDLTKDECNEIVYAVSYFSSRYRTNPPPYDDREALAILDPEEVIKAQRRKSKILEGLLEKTKCVAVERCKKHLNLAYPEKFQHEQCWKG
jgi:hypothetical protein